MLAWEPPARLLLAWQINGEWKYDPAFVTELELTFTPLDERRTRFDLEHRDLDRFGDRRDFTRAALDSASGWGRIVELYAAEAAR